MTFIADAYRAQTACALSAQLSVLHLVLDFLWYVNS